MTERSVRLPAVAGMFYPDDPGELRREIDLYLRAAPPSPLPRAPKALIAPHAGYIYSGPIAASAYATLAPARDTIRTVLLFGPSHRVAFRGIACSSADLFRTPLGDVPVAHPPLDRLPSSVRIAVHDTAHRQEHGLEVHLPFLQTCLQPGIQIVPCVVGDALAEDVAAVLDAWWGGDDTLVVISSDLSHYLPYRDAQRIDRTTTGAIERLDADAIDFEQACGRIPIQGLLRVAATRHLHATTLDLRNSGDTAGDRHQVVGYGAYAFTT